MKKCPTCEKTFEDSMRFCQADGTPLVDDAPAFDPYATIVGKVAPPSAEEAATILDVPPPVEEPAVEAAPVEEAEPAIHQTVGSLPIGEPEDVLDLPQSDPLKTMYASDSEMQEILTPAAPEQPADAVPTAPSFIVPEIPEEPEPAPPSFIAPEPPSPGFGDMAPPPSPFTAPDTPLDSVSEPPPEYDEPATMIQSSFDPTPAQADPEPQAPAAYGSPFDAPSTPAPPAYDEPEVATPMALGTPFDPPPPAPVAEWTPPPAPDASWQNQEIGSNTPFQPPPPGAGGENKTLAIISLVVGILSLICCSWFLPGLAALIIGFIARGKAAGDPANYGGAGLALGGMITGGISLLLGVVFWILYVFGFMASILSR